MSLNLTSKGLFLLDLNDLAQPVQKADDFSKPTETHATVCESNDSSAAVSKTLVSSSESTTKQIPVTSHEHDNTKIHANFHELHENQTCHEEHTNSDAEGDVAPEQKPECHSSLRSKTMPKSFQVIRRKCNGDVDLVQETSKGAGTTTDARVRFQPHVDGPARGHKDSVRQDPCGKDVQPHVVQGTEMGHVVHPALPQQHQVGAQDLPVLRGEEGREVRIDRCENANSECCRPDHGEGERAFSPNSGSHAESQGHGGSGDRSPDRSMGFGRRPRVVRCPERRRTDAASRADGPRSDCEPTGKSYGAGGTRPEQDHQLHRAEHHDVDHRTVSPAEDPSLSTALQAGDLSADCNFQSTINSTPESNRERVQFQKLVQQYTKELQTIYQRHEQHDGIKGPRLDVLEVFCGPQSQLTSQAQKLGYRAERFGMLQGDLQTLQGREILFQKMVVHRPRHVWFSPTCGPWRGFSCLNGSRSIESWDALQQDRMNHLGQLALGVVILRFQRQHSNHMRWEQPRGSLMLKVPYMQEIRYYMLSVDIDLCTAGNLQDPNNGLFIKKSLTIMSTSEYMVRSLHGLRCPGNHQHQTIEGQVVVEGQRINRSTFTENYPRKFARKLAFILGRVQKPSEAPYRNELWPILAAEEHPEMPGPKRQKLQRYASAKLSRTLTVSQLPWGKRQKCSTKTKPLDATAAWQSIFDQVHSLLPRVGKRCLDNPEIIQQVQNLIPEKEIMSIVACRGASRTIAPPVHILKGMAPLRRCVFTERGSGEIRAEEEWEQWETLAKRNLIRPSHATRINITLFARNKPVHVQPTESASSPCMTGSRASDSQQMLPENSDVPVTPGESEDNLQRSNPNSAEPYATPELPSSQVADLHNPNQSVRFRSLPKDEQVALLRAHKNLGHPSGERLSTLLRSQGFRAEVAQAALELKCSTCQENQQPKLARPGSIRDELDFNDRICMDEFDWTNKDGTQFRVSCC